MNLVMTINKFKPLIQQTPLQLQAKKYFFLLYFISIFLIDLEIVELRRYNF